MIKLETLSTEQRTAVQTLLTHAGYPMSCETFAIWLLQNKLAKSIEDVEGLELTAALVAQVPLAVSVLKSQRAPMAQALEDISLLREALNFMVDTDPYRNELMSLPATEWGPYIDAYLPTVLTMIRNSRASGARDTTQ